MNDRTELYGRCDSCGKWYIPDRRAGGRDDISVDHPQGQSCSKCGGTSFTYRFSLESQNAQNSPLATEEGSK